MGLPKLRLDFLLTAKPRMSAVSRRLGIASTGDGIRFLVVVEGQHVRSFEGLRDLVGQERFKDREFLEVEIHPLLAGDRNPCLARGPDSLDSRKKGTYKREHLIFIFDSYPTLTTDMKPERCSKGGTFECP